MLSKAKLVYARQFSKRLKSVAASGILSVSALLMAVPLPAAAEAIALDGDDIIIEGQDYRLEGVDAFEANQICENLQGQVSPCGDQAKAALAAIIDGLMALELRCSPNPGCVCPRALACRI